MFRMFNKRRCLSVMPMLIICVLLCCYAGGANAQRINYKAQRITLKQLLDVLRRQNNCEIIVSSGLISSNETINVDLKNATSEEVLQRYLPLFNLTYKLNGKAIIIVNKPPIPAQATSNSDEKSLKGMVTAGSGALQAVTAINKRTGEVAISAANGTFVLESVHETDVIQFTIIGFEKRELMVAAIRNKPVVTMKIATSGLDEIHVLAYGQKVSRKTNTGVSVRITAEDIEKTATANPMLALQGRVTGMNINISSGLPGAHPTVQIRGVNTLNTDGNTQTPLYIVDGVPFPASSLAKVSNNGTTYSGSYESPLKSIDPASIASIEVLKDADATAIYGARGANGVIIITTKKGKSGPLTIDADVATSFARIARHLDMMNTEQYLQMRKEAAANDQVQLTPSAYPDIFKWSQTAYTDWQREYLNRTANTLNAELNVSGGTARTRYMIGGGFRREMTIYDYKNGLLLGNGRAHISHHDANNKFSVTGIVNFSSDRNNVAAIDPSAFILLPPNFSLHNEDGSLNWAKSNPLATTLNTTKNKSKSLQISLSPEYWVTKELKAKIMLGYSDNQLNQHYISPIVAQNPANGPKGQATFVDGWVKNFTVEPQLDYSKTLGKHRITALLGGTFIYNKTQNKTKAAFGFAADSLLGDWKNAATIDSSRTSAMYRFLSGFLRAGYNYNDKYIVNLTFRRDGSSRFAPGRRYGNFWSAGAAWVISEEKWISKHLPVFDLLKIRASYGLTGNDNIGDYKYFVNYQQTYGQYEGFGLYPSNLFNDNYQWEESRKADIGLETTLLNNRLSLDVNYYVNQSGNQLVQYPLSEQTGFNSVLTNLHATVRNSGWEFALSGTPVAGKHFSWNARFNISIQKNKLLSFPGLETSSYSTSYAIGQPISITWGIDFKGINPETGKVIATDLDKDGNISFPGDYMPLVSSLPEYYGGWGNTFSFGNISMDLFFSFKRNRNGASILMPSGGDIANAPALFLDRWQKPGDKTGIPGYSTSYANIYAYNNSLAVIHDASYIRLSSLSISYNFPQALIKKMKLKTLRIYGMSNNVFTITSYPGLDPESGMYMPPLRSFTFGLRTQI